jgi:phosphoribosylformimino-5-aminoimidazole carboxamide ribotide isomerase
LVLEKYRSTRLGRLPQRHQQLYQKNAKTNLPAHFADLMTVFRPCIDLHDGCVKQIVGGTLNDSGDGPVENYVADRGAEWFAAKYRSDNLTGGHVIKLGPGNEVAAREALEAYPGGMQIGGGITAENAPDWIGAGASHVIVTSWLFDQTGSLLIDRLQQLVDCVGRERVVLDLSCRRTHEGSRVSWRVAMNRWQTLTDLEITPANLDRLAQYASEFLIHAADVEGLCGGIDRELVQLLGDWSSLPMTYAGGVASMEDVRLVKELSGGTVDVTVGSALDLFGGNGVRYDELIQWNRNA